MNAPDAQESAPSLPALSVIVCCFNSSTRIAPTLDHLRRQDFSEPDGFEIIVVDNNSTDGTTAVARTAWDSSPCTIPFKVVSETRQGLSYARERGLAEARAGFVVFVDDDNWLAPDYLARMLRLMRVHPRAALIGGAITPVFEGSEPNWFQNVYGIFAVGNKGAHARVQPLGHTVPGAGMALRISAMRDLCSRGFEFTLSDRAGAALCGGGDIELNLALQLCGWEIFYDPELRLQHFIPEKRLNWRYACGLVRGMGEAEVFLLPYRHSLRKKAGVLPASAAVTASWPIQIIVRSLQAVGWWLRALVDGSSESNITWASVTARRYSTYTRALWRHRGSYNALFQRVEQLFP